MGISPCLRCTRVPDPESCGDKNCQLWQKWYIDRWNRLRLQARQAMEGVTPEPVGVRLGGRRYAAPHETQAYLGADPCDACLCPRDLCVTPCRIRRDWEQAREVSL